MTRERETATTLQEWDVLALDGSLLGVYSRAWDHAVLDGCLLTTVQKKRCGVPGICGVG